MKKECSAAYEKTRSKYNLPLLKDLTDKFDLSGVESEEQILSQIHEGIMDTVQHAIDFLTDMLHPDTTMREMYESRVFSETERKKLFSVYKQLMYWKRTTFIAALGNNQADNAQFIKDFLSVWDKIKPTVVEAAEKVRSAWEADIETPEKLGYFG